MWIWFLISDGIVGKEMLCWLELRLIIVFEIKLQNQRLLVVRFISGCVYGID